MFQSQKKMKSRKVTKSGKKKKNQEKHFEVEKIILESRKIFQN